MDSVTVSRPWWEAHSRMEIDEKLQVIADPETMYIDAIEYDFLKPRRLVT